MIKEGKKYNIVLGSGHFSQDQKKKKKSTLKGKLLMGLKSLPAYLQHLMLFSLSGGGKCSLWMLHDLRIGPDCISTVKYRYTLFAHNLLGRHDSEDCLSMECKVIQGLCFLQKKSFSKHQKYNQTSKMGERCKGCFQMLMCLSYD